MEAPLRVYQRVSGRDGREALILEHMPLVRHIVGRVVASLPDHLDREDLESAGVCGLVEAAGRFDQGRGVAFATFAYPRIRGAVLDELRRNCPLPQRLLEKLSLIRSLLAGDPGSLTAESLSAATGLTTDEVDDCLRAISVATDDRLADRVAARYDEAPEEPLLRSELLDLLSQAIEELPDQMRIVVTLYYRNELRLKEIGEVLNLSESRVSRILTAAAVRLREQVSLQLE